MQLGERAIKINPAKLPPTLIAHSGKGGDQGAMQKANEVQARLLARMAERKANEEVEAAAKEEATTREARPPSVPPASKNKISNRMKKSLMMRGDAAGPDAPDQDSDPLQGDSRAEEDL